MSRIFQVIPYCSRKISLLFLESCRSLRTMKFITQCSRLRPGTTVRFWKPFGIRRNRGSDRATGSGSLSAWFLREGYARTRCNGKGRGPTFTGGHSLALQIIRAGTPFCDLQRTSPKLSLSRRFVQIKFMYCSLGTFLRTLPTMYVREKHTYLQSFVRNKNEYYEHCNKNWGKHNCIFVTKIVTTKNNFFNLIVSKKIYMKNVN